MPTAEKTMTTTKTREMLEGHRAQGEAEAVEELRIFELAERRVRDRLATVLDHELAGRGVDPDAYADFAPREFDGPLIVTMCNHARAKGRHEIYAAALHAAQEAQGA